MLFALPEDLNAIGLADLLRAYFDKFACLGILGEHVRISLCKYLCEGSRSIDAIWVAFTLHDVLSRSSFIFSIFLLKSDIPSLAAFQVRSKSTPKYPWIKMSLIPAILIQEISGYFSFISSVMFLIASPMISRFS